VVRGDVHAITLPRRRGHVQQGRRYAVIVQADDLLDSTYARDGEHHEDLVDTISVLAVAHRADIYCPALNTPVTSAGEERPACAPSGKFERRPPTQAKMGLSGRLSKRPKRRCRCLRPGRLPLPPSTPTTSWCQ
jgi:hypothetical protein